MMNKMKKFIVALLSGLAASLVFSVSFAPLFAVSAEENVTANENVAIIGTSVGLGEGVQVNDYGVKIDVNSDCSIDVKETLSVEFTTDEVKEFYRVIPSSVEQVSAVVVTCAGNEELNYSILAKEDTTTVVCFGGTQKGNVWTYELLYSFKVCSLSDVELLVNVVDESLNGANAEISLPSAVEDYEANADVALSTNLSLDGKTIVVSADENEVVGANAITVRISMPPDITIVEDAKEILESSFFSMWLPMVPSVLIVIVIIVTCILMVAV